MFDKRTGRKTSKHGTISKWNEQPKGVKPVRYNYKVDETQILPSLRFGIPDAALT
ncbi:hypothetical protein DPMN_081354 [Dreissena polymorpha]|uniref:Uncharacterized protein n=1 Tax=Dreissena polymorpha TaxID=45954 RepID=A0A9D3Y8R8_DREPO|nr:hypothetical protein DPMN_081354 [Dreissena polymorpha]